MQPSSAPSACPRSPAAPAAVSQQHPASTLTTTGKLIATLTDPAGKVVNSVASGPDDTLAGSPPSDLPGMERVAVGVTAPTGPSVARRVPVRGARELAVGLEVRERAVRDRTSQHISAGQRRLTRIKGERSVKPSAQPTLVRTQHLPPPAKTARYLGYLGYAGRFSVSHAVSPCRAVDPCVAVSTDAWRTGFVPQDGRCAPSAVSRTATDGPRQRRVRAWRAAAESDADPHLSPGGLGGRDACLTAGAGGSPARSWKGCSESWPPCGDVAVLLV
jgi:hypothetical protein